MSLDDYMSLANHYLSKASKRTEEEPDFTERDRKIALNADFIESGNIIVINSPEYLKGMKTLLFCYLYLRFLFDSK